MQTVAQLARRLSRHKLTLTIVIITVIDLLAVAPSELFGIGRRLFPEHARKGRFDVGALNRRTPPRVLPVRRGSRTPALSLPVPFSCGSGKGGKDEDESDYEEEAPLPEPAPRPGGQLRGA